MECKIVVNKKKVIEIEFNEKEIPVMLSEKLSEKGVDAYWYEPHPLLAGFILHVEADDAMKEFTTAVKSLEKDWKEFKKVVEAKL